MPFVIQDQQLLLTSSGKKIPVSQFTKDQPRPFYLYDLDEISRRAKKFLSAGFNVHYAMKANGHGQILRTLSGLGVGADVVSLGELKKALRFGMDPKKIIFSGVAKTTEDFALGLEAGIYQFNVESINELKRLGEYAKEKKCKAPVALRLNLDIYAPTHPYIQTGQNDNKFGVDVQFIPEMLEYFKSNSQLELKGLACHVGSQIMDLEVFKTVADKILEKTREFEVQGFKLERLDLGGGLGINYQDDGSSDDARIDQYLQQMRQLIPRDFALSLEPGRVLVARSGVLVGKVLYVKKAAKKTFVILNTGSHHLVRPALYQAFHRIVPVMGEAARKETEYDFVGPLCESSDFLALKRITPEVREGEWVAVMDGGAYGRVMATQYNEHEYPDEFCVLEGRVLERDV